MKKNQMQNLKNVNNCTTLGAFLLSCSDQEADAIFALKKRGWTICLDGSFCVVGLKRNRKC